MSQPIKCPVCSSPQYTPSYSIRNYRYYSCNVCGMLFLSHQKDFSDTPDKQYDGDYFKDTIKDNMSGYMDYAGQSRPLRKNFKMLLSRISKYTSLDSGKSLLDIGCAYGFLLDEAKRYGMTVHGVDLSESAIDWMEKNLGINGTVGLSSDAPNGLFDVITVFEVIEHTNDPHSFLDDLYKRLKTGGLLVISTGANDTLVARLLGKRWWYLNPPDHCLIFSMTALRKLLSTHTFELLEHSIIPFHWVGLNNMLLKLARILEVRWLGLFASKLPALSLPVFHYTTQLMIAKKR